MIMAGYFPPATEQPHEATHDQSVSSFVFVDVKRVEEELFGMTFLDADDLEVVYKCSVVVWGWVNFN